MNKLIRAYFLFLGQIFVANLANTQSGTVKDARGAILPNATVSARNLATGVETMRTTN
jgi:hypothetical protein